VTAPSSRLAVVPVRRGRLPLGGDEVIAEAHGRALLIGVGAAEAAGEITVETTELWLCEKAEFHPGSWARRLNALELVKAAAVIVLPAGPDGRDLGPRLALASGRRLHSGVVSEIGATVTVARHGSRSAEERPLSPPAVVTLVPGSRGSLAGPGRALAQVLQLGPDLQTGPQGVEVLEVSAPDPTTMDLAESPFILAGGMGLGTAETFGLLGQVATSLGASLGATRVVTDAGWTGFQRQIGTTGVAVDPDVYVAFGISGAVQHTSGLGRPEHVISVNVDPSCPMMAMAELAIVADAPAVVEELAGRLRPGGTGGG
jgi:electron transfer flavoprotein alpha subunit